MNAHIIKRNKESFKFLKFSNPSFIGENGLLDFNSPYQFRFKFKINLKNSIKINFKDPDRIQNYIV